MTCCYTTVVFTGKRWAVSNRLLSTIDSNVVFVHSQYSCIFTLSVQLYFYTLSTAVFLHHYCQLSIVSNKIISDNFRTKSVSYSEKGAILSVIYFPRFTLFYLILKKTCQIIWKYFVFLVIFDTCDVVYNWSFSLLPPIVLDNLFGQFRLFKNTCFVLSTMKKKI